jgi:hypothetical protein
MGCRERQALRRRSLVPTHPAGADRRRRPLRTERTPVMDLTGLTIAAIGLSAWAAVLYTIGQAVAPYLHLAALVQ